MRGVARQALRGEEPIRRVALVVPGIQYGGGIPTVAQFLHRLLESTGRYEPALISLSIAADDALSVLLLKPSTWMRGVLVSLGKWRGLPVSYVGVQLAEFEFQRFRPRQVLIELLDTFDLIQVISGTPAMGLVVDGIEKPSCLFVATTIRRERVTLLTEASGPRGLWLKLMTAINAWSESRALRTVDHVFALSDYTRSQLSGMVPGSSISLGWPGVDVALFHPPGVQPGPGWILSVGRFGDPRKNARLLFQAYRLLRERLPEAPRLLLVGGQPRPGDWAAAVQWGVAGWIDVLVDVPSVELASLYRKACLFVLSSNEEGLGIVLLEAMASGLPVVSTRCGGPETCVVEGETGYLTPVGDAEALANRMQTLLENADLRRRMGKAGRKMVETRFSIEAAGRPFLQVYDRLLGREGKPA